jgi:uncharacterized repeat protein (TIGR01451 family)
MVNWLVVALLVPFLIAAPTILGVFWRFRGFCPCRLVFREANRMCHKLVLPRTVGFLVLLAFVAITPTAETSEAGYVAQLAGDSWPMYQHDPAHSGRTLATISNNGPFYLQWAYAFGERVEVEAQPVLADGVIYQGVMNGEMHAIDADTGEEIWIKQPGGPIPHTAAVYEDRVYFGSLDGNIYALSTTDGSTDWHFSTDGPVMSAPAVVDGRVYIGSTDGNLYILNAVTGAKLRHVGTGGPVISSPAVAGGRAYFGSEDMKARCVDTDGNLIWETLLYGAGMHNTHPVVSDDGNVVIFVTVKSGSSSYVHNEGYPNASVGASPVETWNTYYQAHPTHRFLYYLDADDGDDLWNPITRRYVPMPIPYWGLLHPILAPDGTAWFPAPAGTQGHAYSLDHDNRLFRADLITGETSQVAGGGSMPEFQLRSDEVGRHIFAGNDYYYTISEDLGVYRPGDGTMHPLFANGNPSGYSFGSHMDPHSPLPSRHLWRYGGTIAMGGVPGASPPIVANNMVYFNSYGWLYAVGPTNLGYNPATSFPRRDARLHELTYPRSDTPTYAEVEAEVEQRVADIIALGPDSPPMTARWEQCWDPMLNNEFTFEVYGFEADLVRVLSEASPHLPAPQRAQLKSYLAAFVADTLLNSAHYGSELHCIHFGEEGLRVGDECQESGKVIARWLSGNMNLVALRLYALWAYADATGDWNAIENNWTLITQQFEKFTDAYDPTLGFCNFEEWRVKRLNMGAQIGAAQAVRDMAARLGHADTQADADALLINLLDSRVALADFVPHLYDTGQREEAEIRLNPDGTINNDDIMQGSPYNNELIPYSAVVRNRETDPSQVNWWDGSTYRVDAGTGFMYYPALSGYFPLSSEMIASLRAGLLDKTRYYVKSYEVNNPWWWMSDLAHHTTGSGEHLYHSPTLAWTMFQVKAWVLEQDWYPLVHQLPEPVSFNSRYDLYRLQNLVTLLAKGHATNKRVSSVMADEGDILVYTISVVGTGSTATVTDSIPAGTTYVPDSAQVEPQMGTLTDDFGLIHWTGVLTRQVDVQLAFSVTVTATEPLAIVNAAAVDDGEVNHELTAITIANGFKSYLPIIIKGR